MFLRTEDIDQIKTGRSKPTHISLFTGCGGFDIGFSLAGFESRVMVEWDKFCCKTLRANWFWEGLRRRKNLDGTPQWETIEDMKKDINHYQDREPAILERDITKLTTEEILKAADLKVGEATIISGGPPCQGFSHARGKRYIDDPRNVLFKEFVRIVREAVPMWFIFENVPGLVSMANGDIIKQICEDFAGCGYDIKWEILNAADYGVPQNRKRVFIIGKRIDVIYLPEEGNPQLHMGAIPGKIDHPKSFREKHGMIKKGQGTLASYEEQKPAETIEELLQQLNK